MYAVMTKDEDNIADGTFSADRITQSGRLLKKFQMLGVKERGMRRTLLYAAMTKDEDNNADGTF